LTFSRAENNEQEVAAALKQGMNVAVVYDQVPDHIYNADATDLRFLDGAQGIIGVRAKGPARRDTSGFVIRLAKA
jgi:phage-related protein